MTDDQTRRTTLGGIAITLVGLAGCLGGPKDESTQSSSPATASAFEDLSVDGQSLVVEVATNAEISRVNVIAPNGEQFASAEIATGAQQVSLRLGTDYQPGDYRVVGVADGSTIAETTVTIQPDVRIQRVGVGANNMDQMPDELEYAEQQATLQVENKGNGPTSLRKLLVIGEVPNPTTDLKDQDSSGIHDSSDGYGTAEEIVLPSGTEKTIFTTSMPFLFAGENGVSCEKSRQQGTGEVQLTTKFQNRITQQFKTEYTSENGTCSSRILKLL